LRVGELVAHRMALDIGGSLGGVVGVSFITS
jgi:hypothetical protein